MNSATLAGIAPAGSRAALLAALALHPKDQEPRPLPARRGPAGD